VPGHRLLRRLRPVDGDTLRRHPPLLRVLPLPPRPGRHRAVRLGTRRHRRRRGHPGPAVRGRPRPARAGPGRRRAGHRPPPAIGPRRRAGGRTRPYQADRAERAFHACEPENRLVVRSLEARWETALAALAEAKAALATQQASRPPLPSPQQLCDSVADLPALWASPSTSDKDRKRLLRTLLGDVTITPSTQDRTQLSVGLRWKSGATERRQVTRRTSAIRLHNTDPAAIALAHQLGPGMDNTSLAAALNTAGHTTGTGQPFDVDSAANLRHYHRIGYPDLLKDGELTPRQVAQRVGVSKGTVHYWIATGFLPARRGHAGRWCVPFPPDIEAACRDRAAGSGHQHTDVDPRPRDADEHAIADVAAKLGVKRDVVYTWVAHGHLPARRGPGGRVWISFTPNVEAACLQRIATSYKLPTDIKTQAQQRLERNAV
jgi:predicted DNA-binding transcriptional regulator AlpA